MPLPSSGVKLCTTRPSRSRACTPPPYEASHSRPSAVSVNCCTGPGNSACPPSPIRQWRMRPLAGSQATQALRVTEPDTAIVAFEHRPETSIGQLGRSIEDMLDASADRIEAIDDAAGPDQPDPAIARGRGAADRHRRQTLPLPNTAKWRQPAGSRNKPSLLLANHSPPSPSSRLISHRALGRRRRCKSIDDAIALAHDAAPRGDPAGAFAVAQHRGHDRVGQARRATPVSRCGRRPGDGPGRACVPIHRLPSLSADRLKTTAPLSESIGNRFESAAGPARQAVSRAGPQVAATVHRQRQHVFRRQAARIIRRRQEAGQALLLVEPIQAAAKGAEPQAAVAAWR